MKNIFYIVSFFSCVATTLTQGSNNQYHSSDLINIMLSYNQNSNEYRWLNQASLTELQTDFFEQEVSRYKLEEIQAKIALFIAQKHYDFTQQRKQLLGKKYRELQAARSTLRIEKPTSFTAEQQASQGFPKVTILKDAQPWGIFLQSVPLPITEFCTYSQNQQQAIQNSITTCLQTNETLQTQDKNNNHHQKEITNINKKLIQIRIDYLQTVLEYTNTMLQ